MLRILPPRRYGTWDGFGRMLRGLPDAGLGFCVAQTRQGGPGPVHYNTSAAGTSGTPWHPLCVACGRRSRQEQQTHAHHTASSPYSSVMLLNPDEAAKNNSRCPKVFKD